MQNYSAVIDNTALVYLTHLHKNKSFFPYLKNIFHTLYIPAEVKNEYAFGINKEPQRSWILDRINPEHGFYRLCTVYDSIIMAIIINYKGIDKGEAESYAQFKKINAQIIISDDKSFVKALIAIDKNITVYSTLHLLAWLDVLGYLQDDWTYIIKSVHKIRPFDSNELRICYIEIVKKFSLGLSKQQISNKCSLKKILAKS